MRNVRLITVEQDKCPIDKMVEIQNQIGLASKVIISQACYEKLLKTCDEIKVGYCQSRLLWEGSDKYPETVMELEGPCFNNVSSSRNPVYKSYFVVKSVNAIDICYERQEGSFKHYFLLEGEE